MSIRPIAAERAPRAIGPYSQAVLQERSDGATLWTAGQVALDPATMELVEGDARAQTERVMQSLEAVLEAAGMAFGDVVKTTVFLVDLADFGAMNEVYGSRFAPGAFPARSTVQVTALPRGARVEIELVAAQARERSATRRSAPRAASRGARASPRSRSARR
jgi:2-iminobutanoate/2-iminopropanoate deaminase